MSGINIKQLKTAPAAEVNDSSRTAGGLFAFLEKDISLSGNKLSDKKKERFYSELKILFSAGIDIKTALELVEEEQQKKQDKELFGTIKQKVVNGSGLSDALNGTGKFSPYEYYTLQIGEETGHLNEVLEELSSFFATKIAQKRQVVSAISYPMIVLFTAFGAIFFMLKYVVPMFSDVFKRFNSDLPGLTKFIIHLSSVFSKYVPVFLMIIIGSFVLLYSQRKKKWYKKYSSLLLLKMPFIGDMVTKVYLERFCHSMNLLISSKTQLVNSIELVSKMIDFYPITTSLENVRQDILKGEPLYLSLSKYKIYNKRMVSLIKVAEEVNQLDVIFGKLSKQYGEEIKHKTGLISSMLEPIMIIFLGLLVAVILIAMYLPLFRLGTSIH
jgi:type IV pilus assembly protein PilC